MSWVMPGVECPTLADIVLFLKGRILFVISSDFVQNTTMS